MAGEYELAGLRAELSATQSALSSLETEVFQLRQALAMLPSDIGAAVAQAIADVTTKPCGAPATAVDAGVACHLDAGHSGPHSFAPIGGR